MLKTLVWKESRELMPLVALVFVCQLALAYAIVRLPWMVTESTAIPFVDGRVEIAILFVNGVGAAVIGVRQAARETSQGTYLFLLHRPAARETIFAVKLLAGVLAILLVAGLPLAMRAIWAATPGTHASPFLWSMTTWVWVLLFQAPLLYLAGFLSGLRDARWLGSRLLPLAAGIGAYIVVQPFWPWGLLALSLLCEVALIVSILHVTATQDYS